MRWTGSRRTGWRARSWVLAAGVVFALGGGLGLGAGWLAGPRTPETLPGAGLEHSQDIAVAQTVEIDPLDLAPPAGQRLPLLDEQPRGAPTRYDTEDPVVAGLSLQTPQPEPEIAPPLVGPAVPEGQRARIAIVIDDLGLNRPRARDTLALPAPLTLAFMTYAENVDAMIEEARRRGHEIIVHLPMQPTSDVVDPGPNALLTELPEAQLRERLDWGLSRFSGFVGINNHMGSRFTESEEGMRLVMAALKERGLWFLDSRTSPDSRAAEAARAFGVPLAVRDVFIDNDRSGAAILAQLREAERIALERGYAIAIGHPHPETIETLAAWLPAAAGRGFEMVPASVLLSHPAPSAEAAPTEAIGAAEKPQDGLEPAGSPQRLYNPRQLPDRQRLVAPQGADIDGLEREEGPAMRPLDPS